MISGRRNLDPSEKKNYASTEAHGKKTGMKKAEPEKKIVYADVHIY